MHGAVSSDQKTSPVVVIGVKYIHARVIIRLFVSVKRASTGERWRQNHSEERWGELTVSAKASLFSFFFFPF